jgi:hypothetical protein
MRGRIGSECIIGIVGNKAPRSRSSASRAASWWSAPGGRFERTSRRLLGVTSATQLTVVIVIKVVIAGPSALIVANVDAIVLGTVM